MPNTPRDSQQAQQHFSSLGSFQESSELLSIRLRPLEVDNF
mgnify:CR=1 FL=1